MTDKYVEEYKQALYECKKACNWKLCENLNLSKQECCDIFNMKLCVKSRIKYQK